MDFSLGSFLVASYSNKEENLNCKLAVIQGSDKSTRNEFYIELKYALDYIKNRMYNVFVGHSDIFKQTTDSLTFPATLDDISDILFDKYQDYTIHTAYKELLKTYEKQIQSINKQDYGTLLSKLDKSYGLYTVGYTKALIFEVSDILDCMACSFLFLLGVEVLIINGNTSPTDIITDYLENKPYSYEINSLEDISSNAGIDNNSDVVCSASYLAEKAIISANASNFIVKKDTLYKVIYANLTACECEDLFGYSYKAKSDYLGITNSETITHLPTVFSCIHGNVTTDEKSLSKFYRHIIKKANIVYFNGIHLQDINIGDVHDLDESKLVDLFTDKYTSKTWDFISKQVMKLYDQQLYLASDILKALYLIPEEVVSFLNTRSSMTPTMSIVCYVESDTKIDTTAYTYLTLLAYLGCDITILDPHYTIDEKEALLNRVCNHILGETVSCRYKYRNRKLPFF